MQNLIRTLLGAGVDDIVAEYGKVELSNWPMVNIFMNKWELNPKVMDIFTFAPSINKKHKLQQVFYKDTIGDT